MTDSPWRRDTLGASDAPAVVGLDPFRTGGDLWAQKTGRVPDDEMDDGGGALDVKAIGSALTPMLMRFAEVKLHRPVAREVFYQHPDFPLSCTVDGLALDAATGVLVEAKTAGIIGRSPLLDEYGDEYTDEVPRSVVVQTHHALAVLDAQPNMPRIDRVVVVALLGGRGLKWYEVPRNEELVAELQAREVEWWRSYVVADRCPPDDPPKLPTLKRMLRNPDALPRAIDPVLVAEWQEAKAIAKRATMHEERCKAFVLNALGDAEIGECELGRVTYFEAARAGYTVDPTRARTMRFKPHGSGLRKVA